MVFAKSYLPFFPFTETLVTKFAKRYQLCVLCNNRICRFYPSFHVTTIVLFRPEICHIDGVACSIASSAVDSSHGRVKSMTIKLVFVASPLKHLALMRKSKDCFFLVRNQDNVSEWGDMSANGCFSELALFTFG
jgi:hypothetical protein